MDLLDACLAFALTMGALGTIATIVLEVFYRGTKARKANVLNVLGTLADDFEWGGEEEKWLLARSVINNPARNDGLIEQMPDSTASGSLTALKLKDRSSALLDKISLEHYLRKFSQTPSFRALLTADVDAAATEMSRIAIRYNEVRSSTSADFKRRAQLASIVVGIGLALVLNIDAARIFTEYLDKTAVADEIIAVYEAANSSGKDVSTAPYLDAGVPIGFDYFPWGCKDVKPFGVWFVSAILSGLLIGLGAPFWFDVAKRLAAVRGVLGGTRSSEERLAGKDTGNDVDARKALVADVIDEAERDERLRVDRKPASGSIARIQDYLRELGHLPSDISETSLEYGRLGKATIVAIERYFEAVGISPVDREATFGSVFGPDFISLFTSELQDAIDNKED